MIQKAVGVAQDGKFGPATGMAVKAFQKAHGLQPDGRVGRQTMKVIMGAGH
jgi:peptidoglycan hydrolase-like protein with peptidoglycan-binding domain